MCWNSKQIGNTTKVSLNNVKLCLLNDLFFVYVCVAKCPKTSAFLAPKLKPTPSSYNDIVKFTACWGGGALPLRVPCFFGHLMSVIMNSFNRKCAIWFLHYGLIILCDHETDCNNADTILTPCQLIRAHYCSLYSGSNIQWLEYTETSEFLWSVLMKSWCIGRQWCVDWSLIRLYKWGSSD